MDTRKIQKTGDMHYLYLPTNWCKQNGIESGSAVQVSQNWNGDLTISTQLVERKLKDIEISLNVDDDRVINKILVACYIHPLKSFQITLEKNTDYSKLLGQKNLISLESVEFDSKRITGQSAITVAEPEALLKTMIMKIKNMLLIMAKKYDQSLVDRYEEEIDRSKMIIDKAIIGALTNSSPTKDMKAIDLYYISWISRDLERMADHLIKMDQSQAKFFSSVMEVIDALKEIMENIDSRDKGLSFPTVISFIRKVDKIEDIKVKDVLTYDKRRVKDLLDSISDVLSDWTITKKIE